MTEGASLDSGREFASATPACTILTSFARRELLSIIVPVYNCKGLLDVCVSSLLEQTYSPLEVVLVDDGSTDGSATFCDELADANPSIRVIHQENKGVSAARNAGVRAARGAFVGFADADDWLEPTAYERVITRILKSGLEVGIFGYRRIGRDGSVTSSKQELTGDSVGSDELRSRFLRTGEDGVFGVCWRVVHRVSVWGETSSLFSEQMYIYEDLDYLLRLVSQVDQIAVVNEPLYNYRSCVRSSITFGYVKGMSTSTSLLRARLKALDVPHKDRVVWCVPADCRIIMNECCAESASRSILARWRYASRIYRRDRKLFTQFPGYSRLVDQKSRLLVRLFRTSRFLFVLAFSMRSRLGDLHKRQ